jgi:hypothetical protein
MHSKLLKSFALVSKWRSNNLQCLGTSLIFVLLPGLPFTAAVIKFQSISLESLRLFTRSSKAFMYAIISRLVLDYALEIKEQQQH